MNDTFGMDEPNPLDVPGHSGRKKKTRKRPIFRRHKSPFHGIPRNPMELPYFQAIPRIRCCAWQTRWI